MRSSEAPKRSRTSWKRCSSAVAATASLSPPPTCPDPTRISSGTWFRNCSAGGSSTKTTPARPCGRILACLGRVRAHGKRGRKWRRNNRDSHALASVHRVWPELLGYPGDRPRRRGQRRPFWRMATHSSFACPRRGQDRTADHAAHFLLRGTELP